ncbi:MAG TPA: hypothetical protein VNM92_09230 [Thermoanaerobaculia bacterium]|nr:hypothetical protein [Thermoanaerobaculia bacterium]
MAFLGRSREGDGNRISSLRKNSRPAPSDFRPGSKKLVRTKPAPPDATSAESFYYLKQMNAKTPMVIVMMDGETINGWIEWYDRNCLKVNREGAPNLLIQKQYIKYLYKLDEAEG